MGARYHSFTGCGSLCMPFSTYALATGAVPSGRSVRLRPPRSSKVYISLRTMSVAVPTPRTNTSVSSNVGVVMRPKPLAAIRSAAARSMSARTRDSAGADGSTAAGV